VTEFVLCNWFLCLATSLILLVSLWRYRYLFVKPSIVVILFSHLTIQWAATVDSAHIEEYLPNPWVFVLLVHGFSLIGFTISFFTVNSQARAIWRRVIDPRSVSPSARRRLVFMLAGCIGLAAGIYFSRVPFSATGLAAIFTESASATLAREKSLKLVDSVFAKYSYGFMSSAFAPLLAVLLAERLARSLKHKRLIQGAMSAIAIAGILFVVSLSGARVPAAMIVLTVLLALFLMKGLPIKPAYVALAAVAVLSLPTVFTILREGKGLSISSFFYYLTTGAMIRRVFVVPMTSGLWHVHYGQTVGFVGVGGIPKLALLFGVEPVSVANIIGVSPDYLGSSYESALASTGYVFAYYSYFGPASFVFSLIGLWLLDIALWFYQRLSDNLLLPCVAAVSIASVSFLSSEYTTTLLTHGFGVLLVVALILDRLCRVRLVVRPKQTTETTAASLNPQKTTG
jgi:hypothetical protein